MQSTLTQQPKLELHNTDDRPLNVLILDDLDTDRVRLRRLCRKSGLEFELFEAEDLRGFREVLDTHRIDIAFLDYHLSMDNGLDALKILTAHEDQVHAIPIMVTSVEDPHVIVEAMRSGCADYLTKEELSVEAVRKSVASAFERRMLIAALNEAQSSRNAMRMSVSRIAKTCGPEIRSIMSGTIRHIRTLKQRGMLEGHVSENFSKLERSCMDIFRFLDDLKGLLEGKQPENDDEPRALTRRPVRQALPAPRDTHMAVTAQDENQKEQATSGT
jgi:DNA-binding NarL/FixJ family response regulator